MVARKGYKSAGRYAGGPRGRADANLTAAAIASSRRLTIKNVESRVLRASAESEVKRRSGQRLRFMEDRRSG